MKDNPSLLHDIGLKATPSRLAILDLFYKTKKPLSIAAIGLKLKKVDIDQATIYRMVTALEHKEIIRQVDLRHGHAHYELSEKHHHHLICEVCGKVVDISKCDISGLTRQAKKIGGFAEIRQHSLEFFGICNSCARKTKQTQEKSRS